MLFGTLFGDGSGVGSDLESVNLAGSVIINVSFQDAHLEQATFESSVIISSKFEGADLRNANLRYVNWNYVGTDLEAVGQLAGADMTGFECSGCTFPTLTGLTLDAAVLHDCDFSGLTNGYQASTTVSFVGADLTGSTMIDTIFWDTDEPPSADFSQANLSGVVADNSDWRGVGLSNATAIDFSCVDCHLRGWFAGANLTDADLRQSHSGVSSQRNWSGIIGVGLDLRDSDHPSFEFAGADLSGAKFDGATVGEISFAHANLLGATGITSMVDDKGYATRIGYCNTTLWDGSVFTSPVWLPSFGGCDAVVAIEAAP